MATRYDIRFLAAAIKASYLDESRAKALFDAYTSAKAAERGETIATFALAKGCLSDSQVDIIERVIGKEPAEEKKPARSLGPYQPIAKLGSGAMGVVIKARHEETGEIVALKVLPRRLYDDPEYVQRFVREASNAARLSHPNIMRALGAEKTEDGLYFYAMEFIDGEPVQSILDRLGPIPESQAIAIGVRVCRALQHAREHGIIHRDIKPENIMINRQGKVKLTDLGLAKEVVDTTVTQTGIALGTPHYMSPEQARGDREIDTRSDIYSLGATLYHLLTGEPPFVGKSAAVVITKHLMEQVPSPKDLRPELSDGICQIIQRMMAKEPEDRYQTPEEAIEDLERAGRGESLQSSIDPNQSSVKLPRRAGARTKMRRRTSRIGSDTLVPIISIVLAVLLLGLALAIILREPDKKTGAGQPEKRPPQPRPTSSVGPPRVSLLEKLEKPLSEARAFEAKHRDDLSRQDEVIARWEKLLAVSRGTELEESIAGSLESATQNRERLRRQAQGVSAEAFDRELLEIREQTTAWLRNGQWLEALHAYDELLKKNRSAEQSQRVVNEQKRIRGPVVDAAGSSLKEYLDALSSEVLGDAKDSCSAIAQLQLKELEAPLAALRARIAELEQELERAREDQMRDLRVEVLARVLEHVRAHALAEAVQYVDERSADPDAEPIASQLRDVRAHLGVLGEVWGRVPDGAQSLIGETRKHLGFEGKVTEVRGEQLILRNEEREVPMPLKALPTEEVLSLALHGEDQDRPDTLLKAATFRLYYKGQALAWNALARAKQAGADTRSLEAIATGLHQVEEESLAQKLLDEAAQQSTQREWDDSLRTVRRLRERYGRTSLVRRERRQIEDLESLAKRRGKPALFYGRRLDRPGGTVQLTYDFRDARQFRDWYPANRWAGLRNGLLLPRTNWLLHRAEFGKVEEVHVELHSSAHSGIGLAHVGWALEMQSLPSHLFQLTGLKTGLIGRFFSAGESRSSLLRAPDQILLESSSQRFEAGEPYQLDVLRTTDSVRWSVNGQDLLRYADLPHCGGKRLALFSAESVTLVKSVTILGQLDQGWVSRAEEEEPRRGKALRDIQSNLKQTGAAGLFAGGLLTAWLAPDGFWKEADGEVRFLGGPGALPCRFPLDVAEGTLSGRFKFQDNDEPGAWRLGFRLGRPLGYYLTFSAAEESIALEMVAEQPENAQEPYLTSKLSERTAVQFVPGSWHQFQLRFAGEQIQVSLDKELLFLSRDPTYNTGELSIGGIAKSGAASPVHFKDFVLRRK